jgi:hypothetical protein
MNIEPKKEYTPYEIADHGFILSPEGHKSKRAIIRYIEEGKLKARSQTIGKTQKLYLVKGNAIIKYLEQYPNPQPASQM